MKRSAVLIVSALLLQACQGETGERSAEAEKENGKTMPGADLVEDSSGAVEKNPIAGEWTLVAIDEQILTSGGTPSLVFEDDGSCWGSTGVNKYRSKADFEKLAAGLLELGPAAVTRMAGPPEAMALEKMFLDRLSAVSSFDLDGDTLHLYAGDQGAVTFERVYR